jgi:hypothetical protein
MSARCRLCVGCDAHWSRVGSTTIFEFESRISLSPLFATSIPSCIIAPLSHRLSHSPSSAHWCDIVIHTSCHVHIPSFVVILKSALFAAVPLRHFLTTCGLPHILLLTNLPAVLRWTDGKGLQGRGGLSNVDGCIVSDRRTYSSPASTDFLLSMDFLFGWFWMVGVSQVPLVVHLKVWDRWNMRLVAGARAAVVDICSISSNTNQCRVLFRACGLRSRKIFDDSIT